MNSIQIQQQLEQLEETILSSQPLTREFGKQYLENLTVSAKLEDQQKIANTRPSSVPNERYLSRGSQGSTKRKIQTLEEGNLKERNVVALRELSIEIRSTILTECVKGRKPADLNSPLFGSAACPRPLACDRVRNVELDVASAFGDNVIAMIWVKTLLVREHDRLYPQGALPNLTHPGIHYNLLDDRNIHQHILSHVANLQEVQATVTRCPLNLENGTWWKNVKCLTFKDVILLNNIYCGSNSFEEGAMAVESELECLSTSVSLAYAVNRQQQYEAPVDTARPESSCEYLGETEEATAAVEETTGIDAPSTFELGLPIERDATIPRR
ncbi:hypothetical protein CPB86DRAFT_820201 [Serendipita vermifera]|nr:hypothetical protein CPB86DRAFT_820201 [Serendipita vermifera]